MIFLVVWPCLWKCFLLHVKLAIKHIFKAPCRLVYYGWLTLLIPKVVDEVEVRVLSSPVKCLHTNPGTTGVTFTQWYMWNDTRFSSTFSITFFVSYKNKWTYEEKKILHKYFDESTGSLEYTETHTDPITSDHKEGRCQERRGTELWRRVLSLQPRTLHPHLYVLHSVNKSHKYTTFFTFLFLLFTLSEWSELVIDRYIRCRLLHSPIWHYLQTGVHRQLRVAGDAARNDRAENQSSVSAFHRALLPHLILIFVRYCLLVLVLPNLFKFQQMFLFKKLRLVKFVIIIV